MPHVQGQATGSAGLDPQMQTKHCEKNFLEKKPGELTHYGGGSLQKLLVKANFFFFFLQLWKEPGFSLHNPTKRCCEVPSPCAKF